MADEKISLEAEFEEPEYIIPPHPEAHVVSSEKTESPGRPEAAEETLSDLIAAQIQNQVSDLRSELRAELQNELKGGLELNVKN